LGILAQQDPDFSSVIDRYGKPSFQVREPGFASLLRIILEQQVSLASAKAAYDRLVETIGIPTPSTFLTLDDSNLRTIGFSRQKTRYCRLLAQALLSGDFKIDDLEYLSDDAARNELMKMVGIGPWTADIYLIISLRRPDIWPPGDIALMTSYQKLKKLEHRPNTIQMLEISDVWRPWRTVAATILWHYYVSSRR
jgi:DNA-3-methyladenine glycosylase II